MKFGTPTETVVQCVYSKYESNRWALGDVTTSHVNGVIFAFFPDHEVCIKNATITRDIPATCG